MLKKLANLFILAAVVCFGIAIAVAAGATFVAVWNVWLCAGLAALALVQAVDRNVLNV